MGAWDGYMGPCIWVPVRVLPMGWALAIPTWYPPAIPRVHPLPTAPVLMPAGSAQNQPAQRLADSVKTTISGSPIYHMQVDGAGMSRFACWTCLNAPRARVLNVPTFLIDRLIMRFPRGRFTRPACSASPRVTSDGKSAVH